MTNTVQLLKIEEIANRLELSQKKVRHFIHSGYLKSSKIWWSHRISENNLQSFIKNDYKKINKSDYKTAKYKKSKSIDNINWVDISDLWDKNKKSKYTSAELFCWAWGLSYGLEMAWFENLCWLDFLKEAWDTYNRNFKHPFILWDITKKEVKENFINTVKKQLKWKDLTVLCWWFPCQWFSMSWSRVVEDKRNSLYKDMLEVIQELRPQFIVAENVKGLRSMLKWKVENKIVSDIENLWYEVNVTVLNSANYYVPQKRERIIFIANRINKKNFHPKPLLNSDWYITTKDAIWDLLTTPDNKEFNHIRTNHSKEMKKRLAKVAEWESLYKNYSDSWKKCPWNEASCTIKENHGGVNIHPIEPRVITVREMARLQSFPDDFIFEWPKGKQLVQIWNAVPPLLWKAIWLAVIKSIVSK